MLTIRISRRVTFVMDADYQGISRKYVCIESSH